MSDIRREPAYTSILSVQLKEQATRVGWADGHESIFQHLWLRDNCGCTACGRHDSGSRLQGLLALPEDIAPSAVQIKGSRLHIAWSNDGHLSSYEAGWLRARCCSAVERARRRPKRTMWDSRLSEPLTVDFDAVAADAGERCRLFRAVAEYGFVVVRGVGEDTEATMQLAALLGYTRDTHFGLVSDLTLRANGTHIADFPTQILPHTDETYRSTPTGINIFHCIGPSSDGGGATILVDSLKCAAQLKAQDRAAFDLLCRLPIRHERLAPAEIIRSNAPVFTLDADGDVAEVRLNERTMSALSLPQELVQAAYRALRAAFAVAYHPVNRIEYCMRAGEALVSDNLRVLHGRTAFRGERLLRQTNVMRDEFFARLAYLEETS